MKRTFSLFAAFLLISAAANGQWFNRFYMNTGAGYKYHFEFGAYLHVFDHFSLGCNRGLTNDRVYSYESSLFGMTKYVKDRYKSQQLMVGVTTCRRRHFDVSFMAGPSWVDARIHNNIAMKFDESTHSEYPTYDLEKKKAVGLALRAEALWEFKAFGLNISAQQQLSGVRNEFALMFGINYGIVSDIYGDGMRGKE